MLVCNYRSFEGLPLPNVRTISGGAGRYGLDIITMVARNETETAQQVDFFSRSNPAGVRVSNDAITMSGLITRTQASPLVITKAKFFASGENSIEQQYQPLLIFTKTASGAYDQIQMNPSAYQSSFRTSQYPIDIPLKAVIDSQSSFSTTILPHTTIRVVLKSFQPIDKSNDLRAFREFMGIKWQKQRKIGF